MSLTLLQLKMGRRYIRSAVFTVFIFLGIASCEVTGYTLNSEETTEHAQKLQALSDQSLERLEYIRKDLSDAEHQQKKELKKLEDLKAAAELELKEAERKLKAAELAQAANEESDQSLERLEYIRKDLSDLIKGCDVERDGDIFKYKYFDIYVSKDYGPADIWEVVDYDSYDEKYQKPSWWAVKTDLEKEANILEAMKDYDDKYDKYDKYQFDYGLELRRIHWLRREVWLDGVILKYKENGQLNFDEIEDEDNMLNEKVIAIIDFINNGINNINGKEKKGVVKKTIVGIIVGIIGGLVGVIVFVYVIGVGVAGGFIGGVVVGILVGVGVN